MVSFCLPKGLHGITSYEDFHLLVDSLFILWHDLFNSMASQRLQKTNTRTAENKQTNKQTKPSQAQPKPIQTNKPTNKQTNKQRSKEQKKQTNKQTKKQRTKGNKQEKKTKKDRNNEANKQRYELVKATPCNTSLEKVATSSLATSISALQCTLFEAFVCDVKCCLCCLFQDETW